MTKIEGLLPIPSCCDNCRSINIELTTTKAVFDRTFASNLIYFCKNCNAQVGCHAGTKIPLGYMADRETRRMRSKAHMAFDPLWQKGYMPRPKAYQWIAAILQIDVSECHISWFSKEQLRKVIEFCSAYLEQNSEALQRRKEKRNAKSIEQTKRQFRKIEQRKNRR